MNSKNSNSGKNSESINDPIEPKKIKRRNFFMYLGAGALGVLALKNLPFRFFQQKLKAETSIKVEVNPYAVKRDMSKKVHDTKGRVNG